MVLRKKLIVVGLLASIVGFAACGTNAPGSGAATDGFTVYKANCMVCHGNDGKLGLSGAADLSTSTMTTAEMLEIVTNGKGGMMPYKELLAQKQRELVVEYAQSLRE